MDSTLLALEEILLKAVPTLILLALLHVYLKFMFFKPLEQVLRKRRQVTQGAKEEAEASVKQAEAKAMQFDVQLRDARNEIYQEQEQTRRKWLSEQERVVGETKETVQAQVQAAREQLAADVVAAKKELAGNSGQLADQIADSLLSRRVN